MIDYLDHLLEDKAYEKALAYAEQLLLNQDNTANDAMVINYYIMECRMHLAEYVGAATAGELAAELASELQAWDYYGKICLDLGFAYQMLRHVDLAMSWWFQYVDKLTYYVTATDLESRVWYNLGIVYLELGDIGNGETMLHRALDAASRLKSERHAHGIRQALASAFMKAGSYGPIPRLLAQCRKYIRKNPEAFQIRESFLWHLRLRADFALATRRLRKAQVIALRGLVQADGDAFHQFSFHVLLASVAKQMGRSREALGHALSARVYAILCRRHDLESEAADIVYALTDSWPNAMADIDRHYLTDAVANSEFEVLD